jgi:hypothetical protein
VAKTSDGLPYANGYASDWHLPHGGEREEGEEGEGGVMETMVEVIGRSKRLYTWDSY